MDVLSKVKEILEPLAKKRHYFILEVTYKKEGGKSVLRIIMDKEGGITMDECADLNKTLSEIHDKEDLASDSYVLEVSSPGLDRRLKADNDFLWAIGKNVKITTYAPIDEKKTFSGVLVGVGDGTLVVEKEGVSTEIPKDKIASAKLNPDIDWSNA